ncbi:unnamed protein product [Owenia fusiformis]|uniref:Neural proliferation differentiation and control protein 1 n=1 Tax=Owenia fusiformis TaxID=6347 RepID=A0A8S4NYK0_OWEFU|nr:unnamed protein product [Owenia fusiformis]
MMISPFLLAVFLLSLPGIYSEEFYPAEPNIPNFAKLQDKIINEIVSRRLRGNPNADIKVETKSDVEPVNNDVEVDEVAAQVEDNSVPDTESKGDDKKAPKGEDPKESDTPKGPAASPQEDNKENSPKHSQQVAKNSNRHGDAAGNAGGGMSNVYMIAIIAGCSVAGVVGLVVAGMCWFRLQKNAKAASEVDYPAYGVTGPNKERTTSPQGDRKLAQSAQMYHYQHQKQQMIALEKANGEMKHDASDEDSDEENEEGDYTVYECPGLAPTGDMEVKNPLFNDDPAPAPPSGDERTEK